jgi:Primase C terminal 2 (PriCT-2)
MTDDPYSTVQVRHLRDQLWRNQYRPVAITKGKKFPWQKAWQTLARLDPPHACLNVTDQMPYTGVLCDRTPSIDIDINDPTKVQIMDRYVVGLLGDSPVRFRDNSPRILRPYRAADGWEPRKVSCKNKASQDGVEILAKGNQFFGYGWHPSGAELQWRDPLHQTPYQDLNTMSERQANQIIEFAADLVAADRVSLRASDAPMPVRELTGEEWPVGDIRDALAVIPNYRADYEWWFPLTCAVFDACNGDSEGYQEWLAWSQQCGDFSEAEADKLWRALYNSPTYYSVGTLAWEARAHCPGWDRPSLFGFTRLTFNKEH